jgi:cytochrome c-type biogenesis protein CcmH/NrfG
MSFWRKEVIDFALDSETGAHLREQKEWIAREPANPRPWYNLAQLYRMQWKADEALGLLLEAVRLDETFAAAHVALAEIYAVREDYQAAGRSTAMRAARSCCAGMASPKQGFKK